MASIQDLIGIMQFSAEQKRRKEQERLDRERMRFGQEQANIANMYAAQDAQQKALAAQQEREAKAAAEQRAAQEFATKRAEFEAQKHAQALGTGLRFIDQNPEAIGPVVEQLRNSGVPADLLPRVFEPEAIEAWKQRARQVVETRIPPAEAKAQRERALSPTEQKLIAEGYQLGTQEAFARAKKLHEGSGGININLGDKPLPPTEAVAIGEANAALEAIDALAGSFEENVKGGNVGEQIGAMVSENLPNTPESIYNAEVNANVQMFGRYLEGGKLAEGDARRYAKMAPQPGDSPETARKKIATLRRLVETRARRTGESLRSSGYAVPDVGAGKSPKPSVKELRRKFKTPQAAADAAAAMGDLIDATVLRQDEESP